jgi:hypothetical protein
MPVSRYELDREQQLAAKDSEIALLKANTYNDQKSLEMYAYIDGQLKDIRKTLCDQAVHNQRTEDSFALVRQDVECVRAELSKDIKIEAERRCCADNSIVTYANAIAARVVPRKGGGQPPPHTFKEVIYDSYGKRAGRACKIH